MSFNMAFGMLSGPGTLLLPKFLRYISYVDLSNVLDMDACGSPRFSSMNPSKSSHGYCLTPHTHFWLCIGWW